MPKTLKDVMPLFKKKPYKPPTMIEKAIFETPFLGPFLMERGLWRKARFLLFKAAGEIPIAGGIIESLGRRHGIIAELPTAEHRNLLKVIAAREGARLLDLQPVTETGKQYVFITPKLFRSAKYKKIAEELGKLGEIKFYYAKRVPLKLSLKQKIEKYVQHRERWIEKLQPKSQELFQRLVFGKRRVEK